jgi:hypothetical protein
MYASTTVHISFVGSDTHPLSFYAHRRLSLNLLIFYIYLIYSISHAINTEVYRHSSRRQSPVLGAFPSLRLLTRSLRTLKMLQAATPAPP